MDLLRVGYQVLSAGNDGELLNADFVFGHGVPKHKITTNIAIQVDKRP